MEDKLEQLLNSLIEKGWQPFGIAYYCSFDVKEEIKILLWPFWWWEYLLHRTLSLRELVSKESWLWQFVCEKELIKSKWDSNYTYFNIHGTWKAYEHWNYEYRLIESALKDETELESFILNNIAIKDAI